MRGARDGPSGLAQPNLGRASSGASRTREPRSVASPPPSSPPRPSGPGLAFDPKTRQKKPGAENVQVCCRIRPQLQYEEEQGGDECVFARDAHTLMLAKREGMVDDQFTYDRVFGQRAPQAEVYEHAAKPIVESVLEGFNGTVFAYGQTSSGKTYTMEGEHLDDAETHGVIPRMVNSIFEGIFNAPAHVEFYVKVAIVEIYNERIRDLLSREKESVKIREGASGVYLEEVTEKYVQSEREIFREMRTGKFNRTVAQTSMNEHSSRSHLLFMLTVEQVDSSSGTVKVGRLNLVDLAGSEKVSKSRATGERLDEAKNINRSLSALGNVINALTDKRSVHIPYRDSKLTRLLQDALGGNSKTCLIITVSPSSWNEVETLSTLRFGARAKMIQNTAKVNQELSIEELKALIQTTQALVEEQQGRIALLEERLRAMDIPVPAWDTAAPEAPELHAQMREIEEVRDALEKVRGERDRLRREAEKLREEERQQDQKAQDATAERDSLTYERGELLDEIEKTRTEVQACEAQLAVSARGARGGALTGARSAAADRVQMLTELTSELHARAGPSEEGRAAGEDRAADKDEEKDKLKEGDRPLKRKVSQLDKNLEQLTVMYHKLVYQNNALRKENEVMEKKIAKKDSKVQSLENNLREAKQKYEKLLNQCANLTTAMDVYQGSRRAGRRAMLRVPIRGGMRPGAASPEGSPREATRQARVEETPA